MNGDVETALAAVVACVDRAVWALPDAALVERMDRLQQAQRGLDAAKLAVLRELDGRNLARREGATSLPAWLRGRYRVSIYAANREVRLARALDDALPATRAAVTSGAVSLDQAWAIKEALAKLPDKLDPELAAEAETALVEHAQQLDPAGLRVAGERILFHVAPEVAEEHERRMLDKQLREAWERRRLTLTPDGHGGVRISGLLDAETAAFIQAGIDALAAPRNRRGRNPCAQPGPRKQPAARKHRGPHEQSAAHEHAAPQQHRSPREQSGAREDRGPQEHRSPREQSGACEDRGPREHPAACQQSASCEQPGAAQQPGGCQPPSLDEQRGGGQIAGSDTQSDPGGAGWDERTVPQRRADALREIFGVAFASEQLPDHGGDRPSVVVTVDYDVLARQLGTGTLDTGERLSPETVRRMACDARIIPAVLNGRGQPLDLGRERRLFSGPVRRALVLRDGGCRFPGCDRPSKWCDAHHVTHWDDDGPTCLANGCLVCGYHHRLIHEGDWEVRMGADGLPEFIPPTWVDPDRKPQRNHRPPRVPVAPPTPTP